MFTPHSLNVALLMMITSAICWGSWANTYKGVKNYRFELFYWDYAIGILLISLIFAFTLGSTGNDADSFLNNVHSADTNNIVSTMVGGAIFNLANLLLVAAIDMAGLAIAFPVSIGIALVVGVISSYAIQPKGNAALLAAGVVCAFIAVVLDGKAYGSLVLAGRSVSKKSIVTCVVSGVLMGLWAPFVARAMTNGNTLGPYSIAVFLTLGALLSCLIWNVYFMKRPLACAWPARRIYLGHRHGFQSRRCQVHQRSHRLFHRTIGPDGRRSLGSSRVEGIRLRSRQSQVISCPDVHFLLAGNSAGSSRKRLD